jgi:hypothetical protein
MGFNADRTVFLSGEFDLNHSNRLTDILKLSLRNDFNLISQ